MCQRPVIDGHQRRALPAMGHVVAPEIKDGGNAGHRRQFRPVAQLHCETSLRPVQHGLAVKADESDFLRRKLLLGQKSGNRLAMAAGDLRFKC